MNAPQRKSQIRPLPLVMLVGLGFIALWALGKYVRGVLIEQRPTFEISLPRSILPNPHAARSMRPSSLARATQNGLNSSRREELWRQFRDRFGEELKAEFDEDGHLISVRGLPGNGKRGSTEFSPEDPQKAVARAREVLDSAREILGIQGELPVESPVAKGNAVSSQVFFQESQGGVPIAPFGSITVDLGPQGELLNLSSDYVRDVHVTNERKLDADQARGKAIPSIADQATAIRPIGGNPVIWVSRQSSHGVPEGRHAYEFSVQGRQVIVDAANGNVIYRRDRRDF